jgi:hypothetical protein
VELGVGGIGELNSQVGAGGREEDEIFGCAWMEGD